MNSTNKSHFHIALPHLLVALWVLYLATTIWQHAVTSVQPAWGDGLSYLQKAASFWRAVEQGGFFNPLNLYPSLRPPGTILMSYPFGFSPDFHGYHFRSVFLPILSVIAAVYIAAGRANVLSAGWSVAAIAFLFSSLPMFYWFDWNDSRWINNGWGMVDNFQAGIAALAGAALVRSVFNRSQVWLFVAALLACLTFMIKQSGLMVMGVLGLTWLMVVVFEWRLAPRTPNDGLRSYALKGALQYFVLYAVIVALAVTSEYFSKGNFAYAIKALGFHRAVVASPSLSLLHPAIGELSLLWVLGIGALFVYRLPDAVEGDRLPAVRALCFLIGSCVIWILGLWYWIVIQTGGSQIRYFYPFILLGAICAVPAALFAWPRSRRWIRIPLLAICFAPALNMALLLAAGDSPSDEWQSRTGVSVSVAHDRDEVKEANALLADIRATGRDARVYFFPSSASPQTYVFVGAYEKIVRPTMPTMIPVNPMDWSRGFIVRTNELLESDYILTRKIRNRDAATRFASKAFPTYVAEFDAFDGWLSTLDKNSGVDVVSDGTVLRLLRVVDREKLGLAINQFVAEHNWRPDFVAANQPAPPAWWSADMMAPRIGKMAAEAVGFEDVYQVHALSIEHEDSLMTTREGLEKAVRFLQSILLADPKGAVTWA